MSNFVTPMDCSTPGPSVHGILQAKILEWVARIKLGSPALQVDSLLSEPPGKPGHGCDIFLHFSKDISPVLSVGLF